jgi:exosortase
MEQPLPKVIRYFTNVDIVFISALVALLPLLFIEGQQLWLRRHFQFFPIAILATSLFVYFRGVTATQTTLWRKRLGSSLLILSICIGLIAALLFSPWLAHLAAIVLLSGWLLLRFAGNAMSEIVSWLLPLVLCLPMPSGVDGRLVRRVQIISSRSASDLLDVIGLPHLLTGNVVTIRTKQLFVDEACSGVDSLYALAAAAAVIVAFHRMRLVSSVLMLASVPLWAWAGSVTRLTLIAVLLDRFKVDLSHGWAHELLGITIFVAVFLGMLSMSEMIRAILEWVPFSAEESGHTGFNRLYNFVVMWPYPPEPKEAASLPLDEVIRAADIPPEPVVNRNLGTRLVSGTLLATGLMLLISAYSWSQGPLIGQETDSTLHLEYETVEANFRREDLPESLNGMRLVSFEFQHRPNSKLFYGEYSATWTYLRDTRQIIISLDFPFPGFHALEACYLGSGCEMLNDRTTIDVTSYADSVGTTIRSIEEVRLNHVELGECYLLYAEFDKHGRDVWRLGNRTTGSFLARMAYSLQLQPVTFQLQLYSTNAQSYNDADRQELTKTVCDAAKLLIPKVQQFYD